MLPRLDSIRPARTKLQVTQKGLASLVGVSTSMINQIESGRCSPSYETARRIFEALASLEASKAGHKAGELCNHDIVKLRPDNTMHAAISKMRDRSISQIPVFEGKVPVGVITEDGIMRHIADSEKLNLRRALVREAMDAPPPIVDHETPAHALAPLIRLTKCILVSRRTAIIGIMTASDTLKIVE